MRRNVLPLAVGLVLVAGIMVFGFVGAGGRAEAGTTSTTWVATDSSALTTMAAEITSAGSVKERPGHLVVGLDPGATLPDLSGYGLSGAKSLQMSNMYVLDLSSMGLAPASDIIERVEQLPGVAWAEQEAVRTACVTPNDPLYPPGYFSLGQWGIPRVGLPSAWNTTTGSSGIIVAIIDTGINKDIVDFAGRIVFPYNAINHSTAWPDYQDNGGHGTFVAGVAVSQGNDGQGIAGAAWNVKLMPVKIADTGSTYDYVLADGIRWAVDHGADVINISFAGSTSTATETNAINYALSHGVSVVAAAGNNGKDPYAGISYPGGLPGVVCVGATTNTDARADFSSKGPELDVVAPGKGILSHTNTSPTSYAVGDGTSYSSPLVAGIVALMKSVNPGLSPAQILNLLAGTADDLGTTGFDTSFGYGIVDADAAVAQASGGTTTTSSTTTSSTTTTTTEPSTTTTSSTTTSSTTSTTSTTLPRFADVTADSTPYAQQIEYLAGLGVVSGGTDGLFHPDNAVMRQQFAKMIVGVLGYAVTEEDACPFRDVVHTLGDLYPYHYVAVAWKNSITQGTKPGCFSPYVTLNRAQLITMVARAANLPEPPADFATVFPNFSSVHYPYARKAAAAGLLDSLEGMGTTYNFLAPASRGEVCALLYELIN